MSDNSSSVSQIVTAFIDSMLRLGYTIDDCQRIMSRVSRPQQIPSEIDTSGHDMPTLQAKLREAKSEIAALRTLLLDHEVRGRERESCIVVALERIDALQKQIQTIISSIKSKDHPTRSYRNHIKRLR